MKRLTAAVVAAVAITACGVLPAPTPTLVELDIHQRQANELCAGIALGGVTLEYDRAQQKLELVGEDGGERLEAAFPRGFTATFQDGDLHVLNAEGELWVREGVVYEEVGACSLADNRVQVSEAGEPPVPRADD